MAFSLFLFSCLPHWASSASVTSEFPPCGINKVLSYLMYALLVPDRKDKDNNQSHTVQPASVLMCHASCSAMLNATNFAVGWQPVFPVTLFDWLEFAWSSLFVCLAQTLPLAAQPKGSDRTTRQPGRARRHPMQIEWVPAEASLNERAASGSLIQSARISISYFWSCSTILEYVPLPETWAALHHHLRSVMSIKLHFGILTDIRRYEWGLEHWTTSFTFSHFCPKWRTREYIALF